MTIMLKSTLLVMLVVVSGCVASSGTRYNDRYRVDGNNSIREYGIESRAARVRVLEYCSLVKGEQFTSQNSRESYETETDALIQRVKDLDREIQDKLQRYAQNLYDSGSESRSDEVIRDGNNANDRRVDFINAIQNKYIDCAY